MLGRTLDSSYPLEIRRGITTVTMARLGANALVRYTAPALAIIAKGLDVTIGQVGLALTIAEACGLLATTVGRLTEHLPRRITMVLGLSAAVVGAAVVAASSALWVFVVGLFVVTLGKLVFDIGQAAWVADQVPFARRGRVVGISELSWALGLLVGVSLMLLVTAVSSWHWAYAAGGLGLAVAALAMWRRLTPEPGDVAVVHSAADRAMLRERVKLPRQGWLAVLALTALVAASQTLFVTFGAWLEDDRAWRDVALAGVTFGLGGVELAASSLSALRTDRWGKERSAAAAAAIMAVSAVAFALLHGVLVPALVLLALFIGCFEFAIVSTIPIGGDLVPGRPGAGIARFVTAGTLGRAVVTLPATLLFDTWGIGVCAVMAAALSVLVVALLRSRDHLLAIQPA